MSERFAAFATVFLATSALVLACTSSSQTPVLPSGSDAGSADASHPVCNPGEAVPCVCFGGGFGTTVCSAAGSGFSACTGCPVDASAPQDATAPIDAAAPPDGAFGDAAPDTSAPPMASLVFAHAAPGVPAVRLCLGTAFGGGATAVIPIPALPDARSTAPAVPAMGSFPAVAAGTPGLYPGTIAALPDIADLSNLTLTLYAVFSSSVAGDLDLDGGNGISPDGGAQESCVALIGSHGLGTADLGAGSVAGRLLAGTDFFALPSISAGTLQSSGTYVLSLTGCLSGAGATGAATCGAGYDGGTNAQVGVARLDTTAGTPARLGAQFAHRSSAIEGTPFAQSGATHPPATSGVVPVFVTAAADGGTTLVPLESSQAAITSGSSAIVPTPAGVYAVDPTSAGTRFGVLLVPGDGGSPSPEPYPAGDLFAMPLETIKVLSDWTASTASAPSTFATGLTYTFLLVGDPAMPTLLIDPADGGAPALNPSYDGRGLHFVAFPNRFTPRVY